MADSPVGKTKDAGWQIGHSRTVGASVEDVWELLSSDAGVAIWLGGGVSTPLVKGQTYRTSDGTVGEVRSVRPHDRVRLTWQPRSRPDHATVQIAVTSARSGTTIRLHAERFPA